MLIDNSIAFCAYEDCPRKSEPTRFGNRIFEENVCFHFPECYLKHKGITKLNGVRRQE